MSSAKFWFCVFLLLFAQEANSFAQPPEHAPASLIKTLDSLKKADDLSTWLYTRVDYSYNAPGQTLPFLLNTEKEMWRRPTTSAGEKEAWLIVLSNLGYNQLYAGNILESIRFYERAYHYWEEHKLNTDIRDYVLKPWANNYTRLGDYEKALFIQQKVLEFAIRDKEDDEVASAYNNMAISYRALGSLLKAEELTALGLKKTRSLNTLILLNNTLADIYKEGNKLDRAEKVIAANILRQKNLTPDFDLAYRLLSSYITAGDIALAKQNYPMAQKYYRQSLKVNNTYYKGNRLRERAYIINQLGKVKLALKKPLEAIAYFDKNLNGFALIAADKTIIKDRFFGDNRLIETFYQKALAYLMLGNEKEALENIRFSLFASDKIRFELADVKTRQRFQAETKQQSERAIELAFDLLEKTKSYHYAEVIAELIEQSKARTLLDDIRRNQQQLTLRNKDTLFAHKQTLERVIAYHEKEMLQSLQESQPLKRYNAELKFKLESIEKQIRDKYPALNRLSEYELSAGDLLKRLPAETHLIEYFAGRKNYYAFEIKDKRIRQVRKITDAERVKKMISGFMMTYYRHGPDAMMNDPKRYYEASHGIYKILLSGFDRFKNDRLVVVPDEVIGYVSFDGLVTEAGYNASISAWPFLIRQTAVSYAFSIHTLINQAAPKNHSKEFTGLFITHQGTGQQYIPAVKKEAGAIKNVVSGKYLMDKQATVQHFFEAFDHSSVLHIGTHAYLSGVQKEPAIALDDDQIFLFELSARQNAPALVMLSACRTADGILAEGEGIISLSRGFTAIGAQGTIAGLWNVNDEAAAAITTDVYKYLVKGQKISTALHHAKLNWLSAKRNAEQEYLPYYWDALIYMGYDQSLGLKAADQFSSYTILFAVVLIVLVIFLVLKLKRLKAAHPAK